VTTLWLVRHGQTDWNLAGRWQGQSPEAPPLNAAGRAQAEALRAQLDPSRFDAIYTSDLPRARQTAAILAGGAALPVYVDPRLREINLGQWEGMPSEAIARQFPAELAERQRDPAGARAPGGECAADVAARVWAAADDIARAHPHGTVLIVSHGLSLATLLCRAQSLGLEHAYDQVPDNARPATIEWPAPPPSPANH
jgi:broad specificity phosphatase PhoE